MTPPFNTKSRREERTMEIALIEAKIQRDNAEYYVKITKGIPERHAPWVTKLQQCLKDIEAIEAELAKLRATS